MYANSETVKQIVWSILGPNCWTDKVNTKKFNTGFRNLGFWGGLDPAVRAAQAEAAIRASGFDNPVKASSNYVRIIASFEEKVGL
jgi:hypothetical protein